MLSKMSYEKPNDGDRYLLALLFAYRDVSQESTKISPLILFMHEVLEDRWQFWKIAVLKELLTSMFWTLRND